MCLKVGMVDARRKATAPLFKSQLTSDSGVLATCVAPSASSYMFRTYNCESSFGSESSISNDPLLLPSLLSGKGTSLLGSNNTIRVLREAVTRTEPTNADVQFEASMSARFTYFRFNTTSKRHIQLDDWDAQGRTRTEIELLTKNFLESEETKSQMRRCASAIAAKMAGSSRFGNVHSLVPRAPQVKMSRLDCQ